MDVLTRFQWRDLNLANELLQNDPRLSTVKRDSNDTFVEEKPLAFNRTKMLKRQENQKQKEKDELIRLKAILLKNKRSA